MPTHAIERLVSAVAERGGRVILAGDSRQLPAIAAGGALAGLAERLGAAELTGNRRQADPLQREVARLLSDGEAARAVTLLARAGTAAGLPRRPRGPGGADRPLARGVPSRARTAG